MNNLQSFDELKANITQYVEPINEISVSNREGSDQASQAFKHLNDLEKRVEAKRKELVGPLNDQVARINAYAKEVLNPISTAKTHLNNQLVAFEKILEEERKEKFRIEREENIKRQQEAMKAADEARLKAEELAAKAKEEAETNAMFDGATDEEAKKLADESERKARAHAMAEATRIEFEAKKEHWDMNKEIKDDKVKGTRRSWKAQVVDEYKIPREYLIVDEVKINKVVRAGVRSIPGVKIFEEIKMTGRI